MTENEDKKFTLEEKKLAEDLSLRRIQLAEYLERKRAVENNPTMGERLKSWMGYNNALTQVRAHKAAAAEAKRLEDARA